MSWKLVVFFSPVDVSVVYFLHSLHERVECLPIKQKNVTKKMLGLPLLTSILLSLLMTLMPNTRSNVKTEGSELLQPSFLRP